MGVELLPARGGWMFRLAVTTAIAISVALGVPVAAEAATYYASNGAKCTKVGTSSNDTLRGTSNKDVICGRGGDDKIVGLGGDDILDGGTGNDTIYGSAGKDRLLGGAGTDKLFGETDNDDLDGGEGADKLYGGTGSNTCGGSSADSFSNCRADRSAPIAVSDSVSPSRLDMTQRDTVSAFVRLHLRDDTGIERLEVTAPGLDHTAATARLVSGSRRDGTWEVELRSHRWYLDGIFSLSAVITDRRGRQTFADLDSRIEVVGTVPDTAPPSLNVVRLNKRAVNVNVQAASIEVSADLTDDNSGVLDVTACLMQPTETGPYLGVGDCRTLPRAVGTAKAGTWRGVLSVPQNALSGRWNLVVFTLDRSQRYIRYFGSDDYARRIVLPEDQGPMAPIPGDSGAFDVIGSVG